MESITDYLNQIDTIESINAMSINDCVINDNNCVDYDGVSNTKVDDTEDDDENCENIFGFDDTSSISVDDEDVYTNTAEKTMTTTTTTSSNSNTNIEEILIKSKPSTVKSIQNQTLKPQKDEKSLLPTIVPSSSSSNNHNSLEKYKNAEYDKIPQFLTNKLYIQNLSQCKNLYDFQLRDHFLNTCDINILQCSCSNHKHNKAPCTIVLNPQCMKCKMTTRQLLSYQSFLFHPELMNKKLTRCCTHIHTPPCNRCINCQVNLPCIVTEPFECDVSTGKV